MDGNVKPISLPDSFGAALRDRMFERRISVGQLAQATGVSDRLIRKYRNGRVEPRDFFGDPTPNARKLAEALELPLDELLPPLPEPDEKAAA